MLLLPAVYAVNAADSSSSFKFWKRNGSAVNLLKTTWELGASGARIAKGWFTEADITTLIISGVVSGDIDLDSNKIYNGYAELTPDVVVTSDTNDGSTKPIVANDSDDAEVFSVDSDGGVSATTLALTGATSTGDLTITKSESAATLKFDVDYATPLAGGDIANFLYSSQNDTGSDIDYINFIGEIKDPATGDEDGRVDIQVVHGGVLSSGMYLQGISSAANDIQIQFLGTANFQRTLQMGDNQNFVIGGTGATQAVMQLNTNQTNTMLRLGVDTTSGTFLIDKGSTSNDHEIPVSTNYATIALAAGVTWDPDVSNNVYATMHYDENLVLSGAPQFGTTGTVPAVHNNGVVVSPQEMTSSTTADFILGLERTLNDSSAAGGSDYFDGISMNLTETSIVGWDDVNFFTMRVGGSKKAVLTHEGKLGLGQGVPSAFVDVLEKIVDTGTPQALLVTGAAHTALTAATEVTGVEFDMSATKTWAAGAGPLAEQSEVAIAAPTYAGDAGGALTITEASTFTIDDAPTAGANMTLTNAYSLWVQDGMTQLDGKLTVDENNAPTTDTITIIHGSNGNPDVTGANAMDLSGIYDGNVTASVVTSSATSLGLTTAGNIVTPYSSTFINDATDAANTYGLGYMTDFTDNGGSGTAGGFGCLQTSGTWDACFMSVAGDNRLTAISVSPSDGDDVVAIGGAGITGGSAQDGGDVKLVIGTGAGGGDNGSVGIYDTDESTLFWGIDEDGIQEHNSLQSAKSSETVADDGTITLDTGVVGILTVWVEDEYMRVYVNSDGAITSLEGSANTAITDSDTNLCVYDGGTGAVIKNRLGAQKTVRYMFDYS